MAYNAVYPNLLCYPAYLVLYPNMVNLHPSGRTLIITYTLHHSPLLSYPTHPRSHTYTLFRRPIICTFPATAARQGGSVAASLVDSCEFRTADERG